MSTKTGISVTWDLTCVSYCISKTLSWFTHKKHLLIFIHPVVESLYELHWLPVKARITFKILTFMFNCSTGNAPAYLTELLSKQIPARQLRYAVSSVGCYVVRFNRRNIFSDRSFSIRGSETLDIFKRKLKTLYFRDFYNLF